MIFGKSILFEDMERSFKRDIEDGQKIDIRKEMAIKAMRQYNETKVGALEWINGEKEEYGNGVSTLLMIYNATGATLNLRSDHDDSGHLWKYQYDPRIETGEWSSVLHVKTSLTATGSCAALGYNITHYHGATADIKLVLNVAFTTPYSGTNTGYCKIYKQPDWSSASWDSIHEKSDNGASRKTTDYGKLRVRFNVTQVSSPIFECVATRSDIGYFD